MKWVKSRGKFISEKAKIRDVILPRQADQVKKQWGEKWLDMEEISEATPHIKQGSWVLSQEDKIEVFSKFFQADVGIVYRELGKLSEKFAKILGDSIKAEMIGDKAVVFKDVFDIRTATIDQLTYMYSNVFRNLSSGETKAGEIILKDDNGRPIMGEDKKIQKVPKEPGVPVYSNNLVNINTFITEYNRCYADDQVNASFLTHTTRLINLQKEDHNPEYTYPIDMFGQDMILQIEHKAKDILNISISKFFSSCQHLYTGHYKDKVLANIFDTNSIPAFLKFDSEIHWKNDKISDFIPISRLIIRSLETFEDEDGKEASLFFDATYPSRMTNVLHNIITKYSGNKTSKKPNNGDYIYRPDIDISNKGQIWPYMDTLSVKYAPFIGRNTKSLFLSKEYDWTQIKISPKANIRELIVETTDTPDNMFEIRFNLEWVKFRFLKINDISNFKIKTDSYSFDKCSIGDNVINTISEDIKKLQFISCEIGNNLNLSKFRNLEQLHLVYTLDNDIVLSNVIGDITPKELHLSGDIASIEDNKEFIKYLKSKSVDVKILGPVI